MYSVPVAYCLWLLSGCGAAGFHRFYLGKIGSGLLYLCTGGLVMVGAIHDLFTLPALVEEANAQLRRRRIERSFQPPPRRPESLERTILLSAKKNRGRTTPAEVALDADVSIDAATKALETLVRQGHAELRVSKSGMIVYLLREFATNPADLELEDF